MPKIVFQQITASSDELYGLDSFGNVYRYVPANESKSHKAFWTKLTSWAAGESGTPPEDPS